MKPILFKNKLNGEKFVCDNVRAVDIIDDIEYLIVRRPDNPRMFKMRKDILEKVSERNAV